MSYFATSEERARGLPSIAGKLDEDRAQLAKWITEDIARSNELCRKAAEVRALAQELVEDMSRQGAVRQAHEEDLVLAQQKVHDRLDEQSRPTPDFEYLRGSAPPRLKDGGWGRGTPPLRISGGSYDWYDWVKESEHWNEIERAANTLINTAGEQFAHRDSSRAAAVRAVESMDRTVRRALRWSQTCFRSGPPAPARRFSKPSAVPLVCFLAVALAGIPVSPRPVPGWVCVALLLIAIAVSIGFATRHGFRGAEAATLGVGSSLALFTACYLAARLIDPDSLQHSGAAVSSIAETAFTSLTVGLTGGTIGIDLQGAARVIAFIQILLSAAAVASGIAWAWRRLLTRTEPRDAPSPELGEPEGQ